jgi:pyruvate kinase
MHRDDPSQLHDLIRQLEVLRSEMLSLEAEGFSGGSDVHPEHQASARNLLHYLALRRHDIRELQEQLAARGLSSLGRTESHVISALQSVMDVLAQLADTDAPPQELKTAEVAPKEGQKLLERNTVVLLGHAPEGRRVRIMVTMPSEAAADYELVRDLVASGMNCMRINCAHDGPEAWSGMIRNVRRAEQETGKPCKVCMDVAGPKLRTGSIQGGPAVLKYRPKRDSYGRVESPARIWLTSESKPAAPPSSASACVPVSGEWLSRLEPGTRIRFTDTRGARRFMVVTEISGDGRWAEAFRTAYLAPDLVFEAVDTTEPTADRSGQAASPRFSRVGPMPPTVQTLRLKKKDILVLTRSLEPGQPAQFDENKQLISPPRIGVTLGEFFDCIREGEPIWFDDGKIGGVIKAVEPDCVTVEITQALASGAKLGAEKGINVPETDLSIPSLTPDDLKALEFIVQQADIVGFSFVRSDSDVRDLQGELAKLGAKDMAIILKIETRQGFANLPRILLAAMRTHAVGVMIARGDLAIECGYQRLAEVQEEILWICEAAHLPVIWATQVLESLAKTGVPSRSEITDAAMGERAECVMLNKGPYIVDAVRTLDDILGRMQLHQEKKRSMLRKLHLASAFSAARS